MKDEIKEILDRLNENKDYDDYVDYKGSYFKPLLDYITNLQTIQEAYDNLLRENAELKLKQTKKVFDTIAKLINNNETCTYRFLIYDLLGFDCDACVPLINGLTITNMLCDYQDLKKENELLKNQMVAMIQPNVKLGIRSNGIDLGCKDE